MNSGFIIARASDRPAYQQIIDQLKRRVASGDWGVDFELPSIRALARELRVSVITVRRAYLELEHEGIIRTQQGLGSYVADGAAELDSKLHREELQRALRRFVELASVLGLGQEEMQEMMQDMRREFVGGAE